MISHIAMEAAVNIPVARKTSECIAINKIVLVEAASQFSVHSIINCSVRTPRHHKSMQNEAFSIDCEGARYK